MPASGSMELSLLFVGEVALKATGVLLLAFALAWALSRASAATRRRLWAGAVVALLFLPALVALLPALPVVPVRAAAVPPRASPAPTLFRWMGNPGPGIQWAMTTSRSEKVPAPPGSGDRETTGGAGRVDPAGARDPSRRSAFGFVGGPWALAAAGGMAVYLAGVGLALLRLVRARRRAGRLARGAGRAGLAWGVPADVEGRESDAILLPLTVGTWRARVLLPRTGRDWPAPWRTAVVAHEVAHVRGRDPLWQLLGEIVRALYWFHPLVHLAVGRLAVERELTADDATLAAGLRPSEYARILFELACVPEGSPGVGAVVPLLTPAGLKARVVALLDVRRPRRGRAPTGFALAGLGLITALPLAAAVPERGVETPGPGTVVGRVLDSQTRQPVADAEVAFRMDGWPRGQAVVRSDAEGWFRYPEELVWQSFFGVYARKGTHAGRKGVQAIRFGTVLPTTIEIGRAASLSGRVRAEDGQPVPGARVSLLEDKSFSPGPGLRVLAETDAAGSWRVEGMLYGEFELLVQAPSGVAGRLLVRVDQDDVAGLDVVVPDRWPVSGWLRDENAQPLGGVRIEQSNLRVYVSDGHGPRLLRTLPGERHLDWDETEPDGSFRLLPRGNRVAVEARGADGQLRVGEFHDGGVDGYRRLSWQHVSWPGGTPSTEPVNVFLGKAARISGLVRDASGAAVAGALVIADPANLRGAPSLPRQTITDASGRFEIDAMPGMEVILKARRRLAGRAGTILGFDRVVRGGEIHLTLQSGEHRRDLELALPPP